MEIPTKPFSGIHENVLKQIRRYGRFQIKTGMAIMQFIFDLVWEQSCYRYLVSMGREEAQQ